MVIVCQGYIIRVRRYRVSQIGSKRFPSDVIAGMTLGRMEYGVHGSPSDVVAEKSHVVRPAQVTMPIVPWCDRRLPNGPGRNKSYN